MPPSLLAFAAMTRAPIVRPATPADLQFLWRMLATTADLPPKVPPPVEAVRRNPEMSRYLDGWGRPGDAGVIAEVGDEPVGAAWYRSFPDSAPGYGYVDGHTPEVSIGVDERWRGQGVGRALLTALVELARGEENTALSLSVDRRNAPALALYRSIGFEVVANEDANPTMLLRLVG